MKLICERCRHEIDFGDDEIRGVPVDRGDAQAFQAQSAATGEVRTIIFKCERCGSIRASAVGEAGSEWSREVLTSVKVFDDPTPTGQINLRIMLKATETLEFTRLDDKAREHLFRTLLLCGKKLAAVYKHRQRYEEIEDRLIAQAEREAGQQDRHVHLAHANDLFIEFDEFLVQLKSSLDYLVKIPVPVLGNKVWALQTFGERGDKVIAALEGNIPNPKKKIAKGLAAQIRKHQPWLDSVIDARDRVNHLIGAPIPPEQFMVFAAPSEGSTILQIHRPMWSPDQTVRAFMEVAWENLVRLFEDFVMMTLFFEFKPEYALFHGEMPPPGSPVSPWRVTTDEERQKVTAQPGWTLLD